MLPCGHQKVISSSASGAFETRLEMNNCRGKREGKDTMFKKHSLHCTVSVNIAFAVNTSHLTTANTNILIILSISIVLISSEFLLLSSCGIAFEYNFHCVRRFCYWDGTEANDKKLETLGIAFFFYLIRKLAFISFPMSHP